MKIRKAVMSLFLFVAACVVNPSVGEVVDDFGPPFCDRLKECNPSGFDAAYPGGQAACVTALKESVKKSKGSDALEKRSACTQDEVDACIEDIKKVNCSTLATPPATCNKC
jgi:hypothetical protein